MAISIDPDTFVISVPQADLTPLGGAEYELDLNAFRLQLKDWEDSEWGINMPDTHSHNTTVVIPGTGTLARVLIMLSPYSVTFEDGQYAVNFTGANTNLHTVTNVNQVSIRPNNSAGLVVVQPAEGIWNEEVEPGVTFIEAFRMFVAQMIGEGSVPTDGDGSFYFRDLANTKDRLAGTMSGKARTYTTRDGT